MPQTDISTGHAQRESLVAVVVTYNRLAKLKVTLDRLLESGPEEIAAVLVIDNCSSDGTGNWLGTLSDPRLFVHSPNENLGGAGGFETGMRMAVERWDPDWIVIMDDDGRPAAGAIAAFHDRQETGYDAYASAVYYPKGGICDMNRPSVNPFWHPGAFLRTLFGGGRAGFHIVDTDYEGEAGRDLDATSFVGLFLSRDAIAAGGFPDGRLFIYGDDVVYTLKLRKAGCRIRFSPTIRWEHDFATFDEADRRFKPLWKVYYHHRNLMLVYREAAGILFWPVLVIILPKWLFKGLHYTGERRTFYRLLLPAIFDGLFKRFRRSHDEILERAEAAPAP